MGAPKTCDWCRYPVSECDCPPGDEEPAETADDDEPAEGEAA